MSELIWLVLAFVAGILAGMSWQWKRNEARINELEQSCQSLADALMSPDDDYWQEDEFDDDPEYVAKVEATLQAWDTARAAQNE